jgi:7-cyano-7-deazaguanine synthase in queuosine biosynthesis
MRHHTIICRLGPGDRARVAPARAGSRVTSVALVDGDHNLAAGLGHALEFLRQRGMQPSEAAIDLGVLAAVVTAADTRISRLSESQNEWTREITLNVPVSSPELWNGARDLIVVMLNFLTGDRWEVDFRARPKAQQTLALPIDRLRTAEPSSVCLFSGGLDSFIGAIDLFVGSATPMLVSHYWDGTTSKHQTYCAGALERRFPGLALHHLRARVGFAQKLVKGSGGEDTLRARSFLFFALAAMAAEAIGGATTIYVPENGLISLNVPLDPLRLGALSTRTTHPFYMSCVQRLFAHLGLQAELKNPYAHQTKGEMAKACADVAFLTKEARNTMSCSSPAKARWAKDESQRQPKHCGYCVPCLIRRAALQEGLGMDNTDYQVADLTARPLNTRKAEGRDVRSFQLALSRLAQHPQRARFDIRRPGPLVGDAAAWERVYVAGLQEVGRLLRDVQARPL